MSWADDVLAHREIWGRAPSAYNTQPWAVEAQASGALRIGWQEERHLALADPDRRDLMLSLGCAAESLRIVGAALGHRLQVLWGVDVERRTAALIRRVGPLPATEQPASELTGWSVAGLAARRTARSGYREPFPRAEDIASVAAFAGLSSDLTLDILDPAWVHRWLPVADRWVLQGPAAPELAGWLRLGDGRSGASGEGDGLTGRDLALSPARSAGLRLSRTALGRRVLAGTGLGRLAAAGATARPLGTVVALSQSAAFSLERTGAAGQDLLKVWLAAGAAGWSLHPLSALLNCPPSRADLLERSVRGRTPLAVFRIGFPQQVPPRSDRR